MGALGGVNPDRAADFESPLGGRVTRPLTVSGVRRVAEIGPFAALGWGFMAHRGSSCPCCVVQEKGR